MLLRDIFQAIGPELTFYNSSKDVGESLNLSNKLLHAQLDAFCRSSSLYSSHIFNLASLFCLVYTLICSTCLLVYMPKLVLHTKVCSFHNTSIEDCPLSSDMFS